MTDTQKIKPRVRLIIIKNNKILLSYVKSEDFYFYIGGKMEWGERLDKACQREALEEAKANFTFKKILYVRDYIKTEQNEHSLELYILGDIDKYEEVEGLLDDEFNGDHWQTWIEIDKLNDIDVKPKSLSVQIIEDYHNNFQGETKYLGEIN